MLQHLRLWLVILAIFMAPPAWAFHWLHKHPQGHHGAMVHTMLIVGTTLVIVAVMVLAFSAYVEGRDTRTTRSR